MDRTDWWEVSRRLPNTLPSFTYYRDRYAVMLLDWSIGPGVAVRELKRSRLGALLRKPPVRAAAARAPRGVLTPRTLAQIPCRSAERYRFALGSWGAERWHRWHQTSRAGRNLVVHLCFPSSHDAIARRVLGAGAREEFAMSCHPRARSPLCTLAWSRIDIDWPTREALIEEVQSDWARDARAWLDDMDRELRDAGMHGESVERERYLRYVLRPHYALWPEATLAASLELLVGTLGLRRIYYHTPASHLALKQMEADWPPPRSLYTDLPRRFCFVETDRPPRFLYWDPSERVQRALATPGLRWHRLEL